MFHIPFERINADTINDLIVNREKESKHLEYKIALPGGTDEDKREFLADVSAFANGAGGDIIFGVAEAEDSKGKNTGEPERVAPISGANHDATIRRLENLIRDGIAPRVRVNCKAVTGWGDDGTGFVIVMRLPKKFCSAPHGDV